MNFSIPRELIGDVECFKDFLKEHLSPHLPAWYGKGEIPKEFFQAFGEAGWSNIDYKDARLMKRSALRGALLAEEMGKISPGVGIAMLVQGDLGGLGLTLFGSDELHKKFGLGIVKGRTLICLGNTEGHAGSDVASIAMKANKVDEGWRLNGAKAYVTNGILADFAVMTAITDPEEKRNRRISMFLVDLNQKGIRRRKLNKHVWVPSDLTRIELDDVFVPEGCLMGERGRGLQQVLTIFTHSRIPISALTLGTAAGAFEMGLEHAQRRKIFGKKISDFQAKSFEMADFFARMEAARLVLWKGCWKAAAGEDFQVESSMAKYLAVNISREVTTWAADLFGAASVIFDHPIHKYPMDVWGSSLGEGTQDVHKLVIFRALMAWHQF